MHKIAASTFCLAVVTLLSAAVSTSPAAAQQARTVAPGKLVIAGRRLRCGNVPTRLDNNAPGAGFATAGAITLNPRRLRRYPAVVRWMIYYHECGHHRVGASETESDCYAVRRAKRAGWLTAAGLRHVCASFRNSRGGRGHVPGPTRCRLMQQCFKTAPGRR
ncbi:MAG: hypothetical protein ACR2PO_08585 [Methyloligellaceae bacterium]